MPSRQRYNSQKSPCSDEDCLAIRELQMQDVPRKEVRKQFSHIEDRVFYNIWTGITKAGIVPKIKR